MQHNIESITTKLKIYEGTLIRLCEYLSINLYDQTLEGRMGSKAILKMPFVRFIEENRDFYKRYHDDYYISKTPEEIANTINRKFSTVENYLQRKYPECFDVNKVFIPSMMKKLKYVSSYEIDFEVGGEIDPDILQMGATTWHIGIKQKKVIDLLNGDSVV